MSNISDTQEKGILYVVATPIGNRKDITLRALDILNNVDLIAAEDTHKSGRLLTHYRIKNQLVSYHEHNEKERTPQLLDKLLKGISIALISDAGTPSVSDPGFRLITAAIENRIMVTPIPGVTAASAAMSVSGLPTDSFLFVGFLPKKKGKRIQFLTTLRHQPATMIFYESPRRIISLLEEIISCMGDRSAVLAREMTKLHEEFLRGSVSQLLQNIKARPAIKGECTLLLAGDVKSAEPDIESLETAIEAALENETDSLSGIARTIARKFELPKKTVYDMALKIKGLRVED